MPDEGHLEYTAFGERGSMPPAENIGRGPGSLVLDAYVDGRAGKITFDLLASVKKQSGVDFHENYRAAVSFDLDVMQLLPDYIAYNGGELLGWGFFDNRWKADKKR